MVNKDVNEDKNKDEVEVNILIPHLKKNKIMEIPLKFDKVEQATK